MTKIGCAWWVLGLLGMVAGCADNADRKSADGADGSAADPASDTGSKDAGSKTPTKGGTGGATDGGDIPKAGASGTWPMMGYDERNGYFNPTETTLSVKNAGKLVEKWRFTTAGFPPGTPIVGDGMVFVMATMGTYAIDLLTGKEVWSRMDLFGSSSLAFEPGFVYVHDRMAGLSKLSAATGKTVWGPVRTNEQPGCDGTSSPILGGGKVVVGRSCGTIEVGNAPNGFQGGVVAVDAESGEISWEYVTVAGTEDGAMVWSSVGIDVMGGMVFATTGNNYTTGGPGSDAIHALDLKNGTMQWVTQVRAGDTWSSSVVPNGPDTDFGANPIIADLDGKSFVAAGDKGSAFWALSRDTGNIAWSRDRLSVERDAAHGGVLMNGAFDRKNFYALVNDTSDRSTTLYAMSGTGGGEDAFGPRRFLGSYTWGAPSLANGVLVVPIDDLLYILTAANGDLLNMFDTGGTIAGGAAAIVDGHVIVGSGLAYPFDPRTKNNNQVICYGLP